MAELIATLKRLCTAASRTQRQQEHHEGTPRRAQSAREPARRHGLLFVEILSPCPTIWASRDPVVARKWVAETMIRHSRSPSSATKNRRRLRTTLPPVRPVAEVLEIATQGKGIARDCSNTRHHFKELTVKVAGFGGQVFSLLGQLLTEMGMREGLESAGSLHTVRKCVQEAHIATFVCQRKNSARPSFLIPTFWLQ